MYEKKTLLLSENLWYRSRLLISICFSHACTSLVYGVYASTTKKHDLIRKHLRYSKAQLNGISVYSKF